MEIDLEASNNIDEINKLIDLAKRKAWDLYGQLGKEYSNPWDQYKDMERLGQFAKTIRKLSEARMALGFAQNQYSNGVKDL